MRLEDTAENTRITRIVSYRHVTVKRVAAEATRIRLAYLYDPLLHQVSAFYEHMRDRRQRFVDRAGDALSIEASLVTN
jgi:hypothetical protein